MSGQDDFFHMFSKYASNVAFLIRDISLFIEQVNSDRINSS